MGPSLAFLLDALNGVNLRRPPLLILRKRLKMSVATAPFLIVHKDDAGLILQEWGEEAFL